MKTIALVLALAFAAPLAAHAQQVIPQTTHHSQFDAANAADRADGPGA